MSDAWTIDKTKFDAVKATAYKLPNKCECSGSVACVCCNLLADISELEESLAPAPDRTGDTYSTWDDYAKELDEAAEVLTRIHPIGQVKAIGRREVAEALRTLPATDRGVIEEPAR